MEVLHRDLAGSPAATRRRGTGVGLAPAPGLDIDLILVLGIGALALDAVELDEVVDRCHPRLLPDPLAPIVPEPSSLKQSGEAGVL